MKIVVVGNSRDLLDQENGEKIDQCDRIVRLNSFRLEGHAKHVGTRIDIVSMNLIPESIDSAISKSAHLIRQANEIWTPWYRALAREGEIEYAMKAVHRKPEDLIFADDTGHKETMLKLYDILYETADCRVGEKTEAEDGRKYIPSTGFLTVYLTKARFPDAELFITGFSLTSGQDWKRFSSCDDPMWLGHDMLAEQELLQQSITKGEFKEL